MGDPFETIAETAVSRVSNHKSQGPSCQKKHSLSEVVGWIDTPLRASTDMGGTVLRDTVGDNIPHLGVSVREELLAHPQKGCLRLVFPIAHITEFGKVGFHILRGMGAVEPWRFAIFTSTLQFKISLTAVADVGIALLNQLLGKVI